MKNKRTDLSAKMLKNKKELKYSKRPIPGMQINKTSLTAIVKLVIFLNTRQMYMDLVSIQNSWAIKALD